MHPIRLAVFTAVLGTLANVGLYITRDPGLTNALARTEVTQGQGFIDVAAGATHTCAVGASGGVWCWGEGGSGQLGHGSFQTSPTPVPVVGLPGPAVSVAVGGNTSCAAMENGALFCWGSSASGQIGLPDTTPATSIAHRIEGLGHVHSVAIGATYACAGTTDGATSCWGELRVPKGKGIFLETHLRPRALPDAPFLTKLVAGGLHVCGITLEHDTWCWGGADMGAMGQANGKPVKAALAPHAMDLPTPAKILAAGNAHTCALGAEGDLWCWGQGSAFRADLLGGSADTNTTPLRVGQAPLASEVVAGDDSVCVLLTEGRVGCIGAESAGVWAPFEAGVPSLDRIDARGGRLCGIDVSGNAWCVPLTGATAFAEPPMAPAQWTPNNGLSARWHRLVGAWAQMAIASAEPA